MAFVRGVTLDFSRPCKLTDNAFIESLSGKFRAEVPERQLVSQPRRGAAKMRGLAQRLQRGPAAQRDRQPSNCDASSVSWQSRPDGYPMKPDFSA